LLALLIIVVTIASKGAFIAIGNIKQILDQMVVSAMLTIGAGMLIISGQIDLSTGALGTFAGMLMAFLLKTWGWAWPPALIVTLVISMGFGLLNAAMINELRFQGFIATLATASLMEGLSYIFSNGANINVTNTFIRYLGSGKIAGQLPISVILLGIVFIVYGLILSKSKFGRHMYLVGGNPHASRLSGVNPKKVSYILFANSAFLGSLAGVILAARVGSATSNGIKSSQFTGITASILGGVSFGGGTGGMGGAFVGLLILTSFTNGMVILHFDSYWRQVISGLLLILALTFDYLSARSARKNIG
jgi:ribose/xylose/arabinose/galactoside ABC-type transport system permease subunit